MSNFSAASDPYGDLEAEVRDFLIGQGVPEDQIQLSIPPELKFGELSSNAAFLLAKARRKSPRDIAEDLASTFSVSKSRFIENVEAAPNGFLNFRLRYASYVPYGLRSIEKADARFGLVPGIERRRLLVEHTSVNPNKEWHVGHLRNAVIGDTLVRVARKAGKTVEVQNYIDDTGRQAAEAVLGLREYAQIDESAPEKFDHHVGRYYVRLNNELAGGDKQRTAVLEMQLESVLHEMEEGLHRNLVERVVRAQLETAARLGANYDLLVWESDIVRAKLLDEALALLTRSTRVFRPSDGKYAGAFVIRLESSRPAGDDDGESDLRVLVRSNGIPTYTGKDIPYMMWKFGLLKAKLAVCQFDSSAELRTSCPDGVPYTPTEPDVIVNVVAEHQALQQQTVIEGLAVAGYPDHAARAQHLSYGLVRQAAGRISGRAGSGSSADDVMDEAQAVALARLREKRPDLDLAEQTRIAEAMAIGSLRYLMVQYSPVKPIIFDLDDVVNFEGNTGLYLQYALVRLTSILRRAAENGVEPAAIAEADFTLLVEPTELALVLQLTKFPRALADVLRTLSVNIAAEYAYQIAAGFSQFYRDCPILQAEHELRNARLRLLGCIRVVLSNAMSVLGIPIVDRL